MVRHFKYKRFDHDLPRPHKEFTIGNAGFDLFARLVEPITVLPGDAVRVPLNFACEIPHDMVGLLFQRSSTFKKWGVRLTNNVGVIDSSYCGDGDEWAGEFQNMTPKPVTISRGDKLCQAVFLNLPPVMLDEVESLHNVDRGGFGTSFDNATVGRVTPDDKNYYKLEK